MSAVDHLSAFLDGAPLDPSAEEDLRAEMRLMVATLSMVRESLAQIATDADARSREAGAVTGIVDSWGLGYAAGRAREGQSYSSIIGALQNSLDIWATSGGQKGGGA